MVAFNLNNNNNNNIINNHNSISEAVSLSRLEAALSALLLQMTRLQPWGP